MAELLRNAAELPALLFLTGAFGLLIRLRLPRLGCGISLAAFGVLFCATIPLVGTALLRAVEVEAPTAPTAAPQAIVVLAAGYGLPTHSEGLPVPGPLTLERLRAAAALSRRTGLPLLVSGGPATGIDDSLGNLMRRSLETDFDTPVRWIEARSLTTAGNAKYSAKILQAEGVKRVYLVTHAFHMARAMEAFSHFGIATTAHPVGFAHPTGSIGPEALIPSASALKNSQYAFHEWIGTLWYKLSGFR